VRPKSQKDELAEEYKSKPSHNPFGGAKPRDEVRRAHLETSHVDNN